MKKVSPNIHDHNKVVDFSAAAYGIEAAITYEDVPLQIDGDTGEEVLDAIHAGEFPVGVQLSEAHRLVIFDQNDVNLYADSFVLKGVMLKSEQTAHLEVQRRGLGRKMIAGFQKATAPFDATLRVIENFNQRAVVADNN